VSWPYAQDIASSTPQRKLTYRLPLAPLHSWSAEEEAMEPMQVLAQRCRSATDERAVENVAEEIVNGGHIVNESHRPELVLIDVTLIKRRVQITRAHRGCS
jgi:hypothetical protein